MIISRSTGMVGQRVMRWDAGWPCPMGSPQLDADPGELTEKETKLPKGVWRSLFILAILVPSVERPVHFPPYSLLSTPLPVTPNTSLSPPLIQDITEDEPLMILSPPVGAYILFPMHCHLSLFRTASTTEAQQPSTTLPP